MKKYICPRCNGGEHDVEIMCRTCNGTGYARGIENKQCQTCKGEGTEDLDPGNCPLCHGDKQIGDSQADFYEENLTKDEDYEEFYDKDIHGYEGEDEDEHEEKYSRPRTIEEVVEKNRKELAALSRSELNEDQEIGSEET